MIFDNDADVQYNCNESTDLRIIIACRCQWSDGELLMFMDSIRTNRSIHIILEQCMRHYDLCLQAQWNIQAEETSL